MSRRDSSICIVGRASSVASTGRRSADNPAGGAARSAHGPVEGGQTRGGVAFEHLGAAASHQAVEAGLHLRPVVNQLALVDLALEHWEGAVANALLGDPAVTADPRRLRELSKERARLEHTIKAIEDGYFQRRLSESAYRYARPAV